MILPMATFANEAMVRALLESLDRECSSYCVLGGYEDLPGAARSDIDFMVGRQDFERLPQILSSLARKTKFRLVRNLEHEITACCYALAQSQPGQVLFLHPDACSDYRRANRTWLRPEAVLARRRRHRNGFWIPAATDAFLYYFIKRIEKLSVEEQHAQQLSRLFSEDRQGCTKALMRRLTPVSVELVVQAANSENWQPVTEVSLELRKELLSRAPADSLKTKYVELKRIMKRAIQPTGLCVAVIGPDTSSKSTVVEQYLSEIAPACTKTACFHLRPRLFGDPTKQKIDAGPRGHQPRGILASTGKLLFLWSDYLLGYYLRIYPLKARSTLVVFDGYYYDLLIDPFRFRFEKPRWLARLISALIPLPDLILIPNAPDDAHQDKRQGVTVGDFASQAKVNRLLVDSAGLRKKAVLIDAARSLEAVADECADQTLAYLERRTAKRLHLSRKPR